MKNVFIAAVFSLAIWFILIFSFLHARAHEVAIEHEVTSNFDFCIAIPPDTCADVLGNPMLNVTSRVVDTGSIYEYTWHLSCATNLCETMTVQTAEIGTCASISDVAFSRRSLADNERQKFAIDPQGFTCATAGTSPGALIVNFNLDPTNTALNRISFESTCAPAYVPYATKGSPTSLFTLFGNGTGTVLAPWCGAPVTDADGDGRDDSLDNCLAVANGEVIPDAGGHVQRDADSDGFGNVCDADFNNDGIVDDDDLALFQAAFFGADPVFDLDGDGYVNYGDLPLFNDLYGKPPGP